MKKKPFFLLTLLVLVFALRAMAAGGSSTDPLITVSYLTNTFLPSLQSMLGERAKEQTAAVYQAAEEKVDSIGSAQLAGLDGNSTMEGWSYSASYTTRTVKRGDTLTLSSGSGVLWQAGRGTAAAGLVDVTAGTELAAGTALTANHRYLNGTEGSVTVTVLSDAAILQTEGFWILTESGEDVTAFTDLTISKDWFYEAVWFVIDRGLFNGVSETVFSPNSSMDRSMLATVLYRMAGTPTASYAGAFSDVADGQWYTAGIEWAASCGVVTGYDDGTFLPSVSVTREQIALMLYRYAGLYLGMSTDESGDLSGFADGGRVSFWAEDAVRWAVGAGILSGFDDGTLKPVNTATRAEVATMLQRMMSWAGLLAQ